MKTVFFRGNHTSTRRLTIFFSGWGMDENPFLPFLPPDRDCLIIYDYVDLAFDPEPLRRYETIYVLAWSMGVWAAARILPGTRLAVAQSVAVNGTMQPIDDLRGIPRAVFAGTIANLSPESVNKFQRRMCVSSAVFDQFAVARPQRDIDSLRNELRAIATTVAEGPEPVFTWDAAVIGGKDRIFPKENQLRAWEGRKSVIVEDGHWLSAGWHNLLAGGTAP